MGPETLSETLPLPTMLFVRTYKRIQGGHFKVADYIEHVRCSRLFRPALYLAPTPMAAEFDRLVPQSTKRVPAPFAADAFFVAGNDWRVLDEAGLRTESKPVVNLIQGFSHSRPGKSRHAHLQRRALRVCVSEQVRDALVETGKAVGPVVVVPNGVDQQRIRTAAGRKHDRIFILGVKEPDLARTLATGLAADGLSVDLCADRTTREDLLRRMGACTIAVVLPKPREGFCLPALEAMILGCAVAMPDCIGSRSFCIHDRTCLVPPRAADDLRAAVLALTADRELRNRLVAAARSTSMEYTLEKERKAFLGALEEYLSGRAGAE